MKPEEKKNPIAPVPPVQDPGDRDIEHQIELEKLAALKAIGERSKEMGTAADFVNFLLKALKGEKGDEGKAGKDADEKKVVEDVMGKVKDMIPTAEDVAEIVLPRMEKPKDGKEGPMGPQGPQGDAPKMSDIIELLLTDKVFLAKAKGQKGDKGDTVVGKPGKDGSPDTAEQIVAKINAADFQIDASKVRGIFKQNASKEGEKGTRQGAGYLADLSDVEILSEPTGPLVLSWSTTKKKWVPVTVGALGGVPIAIDISSQFNGVLKTFVLPAYSSILQFNLTGWPPNGILRPTVDFTTPSGTTVTLTGEVSAPAAGTTGIILIIPA